MSFKFEQLRVWELSLELSERVHKLCRRFPQEEVYVLCSQMRRAADSVSLNICEGCTGNSNAEFSKFLGYSIRSAIEVVGCLYLSSRRGYIDDATFRDAYEFLNFLVRSLQSFRNSLKTPILR